DSGIADIATRAIDQAATLKQVNTAIGEIDHTTQQNAAMAEESTAACHALAHESEKLTKMIEAFNTGEADGRRFLPAIPAGEPVMAVRASVRH
ncbi:MAG: hypothetical protein ABL907_12715, partial [Hyphomicrobium sp.]